MMLLSVLRVSGHSMEPAIRNGALIFVSNVFYIFKKPRVREIVVFIKNKKTFIKRIKTVNGNKLLVEGDNKDDSFEIGWIEKNDILGVVLFTF